jgi:hypothetical protein
MTPVPRRVVFLGLALLLASGAAAADKGVEVAPFIGLQFAGSVGRPAPRGGTASSGIGVDVGGTVNLKIADEWRVELLYSRQEAGLKDIGGVPRFDVKLERYMAGIVQETGEPDMRFFGVFLLGVTRFAPGRNGIDDDARFTLGLSLGLKRRLADHLGLRAEGRGFFVTSYSATAAICSGSCVFLYRGSGLWQGDVSAGLLLSF